MNQDLLYLKLLNHRKDAYELLDYTAVELAAKIKAGETTATEAMEAVIAQIENLKMSLTVMSH